MRDTPAKPLALLLSVLLHILLWGALFSLQDGEIDARWSGGRDGGSGAVFVDITSLGNASENDAGPAATPAPKEPGPPPLPPREKIPDLKTPTRKPVARKSPGGATSTAGGRGDSDTPAGGQGPGLDKDGAVAEFAPNALALIRKKIVAKQNYPETARDKGLSGTVRVGFRVNADGGLDYVKVLNGSGHAVLDEAALKSVRKAAPLPYFPQDIALSLEYRLR